MKNGWQTRKLGEVCSFLNRGISPAYLEDGGICVLNQKCIRDHRVSYEPSRRHDAGAKKVTDDRLVQAGDVLVNSTGTGTLGRVAQLHEDPTEPTTVDSHVTIVRPKPGKFHQDFFGYMLVVIEDAIKEAGEGCGGQTELARSVLAEKFSVSYPESLPEQQRIVGILDEAFEDVATAKANAEKNLQNARAVFESHLQSVFARGGECWAGRTLGDITDVQSGGTPLVSQKEYWGGDIPWYSSGELNATRTTEPARYVTEAGLGNSNAKVFPCGSLLIGMYDTAALKMSILDRDGTFNQAVAGVKPSDQIDAEFLMHAINAIKPRLLLERRGVRQKNLSLAKIKAIQVPLPGIDEQRAAVHYLGRLLRETQALGHVYQRKLAALDELKKSLLHQAFTGQLGSQAA
jgi:type I restriction enzyme S subunit